MSEMEVTLRWNISSADEPLHLNIINVVKLDPESFRLYICQQKGTRWCHVS